MNLRRAERITWIVSNAILALILACLILAIPLLAALDKGWWFGALLGGVMFAVLSPISLAALSEWLENRHDEEVERW